jgi:hypothetical protein
LILRLTCPGCNKDSYSASVETFKPCPYCGILFSGKYGNEKRREFRIKREIPFTFSYDGRFLEASTLDISERGLCIKIFGQPSLPVGDVMDISIKDRNVKAQVMWVSNNPDTSVAVTGLRVLDGNVKALQSSGTL